MVHLGIEVPYFSGKNIHLGIEVPHFVGQMVHLGIEVPHFAGKNIRVIVGFVSFWELSPNHSYKWIASQMNHSRV